MKKETRRQVALVGVLVAAVLLYLNFGSGFGGEDVPVSVEDVPPIDVAGLTNAIKNIQTIDGGQLVIGIDPDSEADRNLFQYGVYKPPPPTPAEIEAQRRQAQAQLEAQEAQIRAQKQAEEDARRRAEEAARLAELNKPDPNIPPPPPPAPPPPEPPAVNYKLMGMMGTADKKMAVFLDGDRLHIAKQGQVLEGKFKLLTIGAEHAVLGYVAPEFKDRTKTIQLGH